MEEGRIIDGKLNGGFHCFLVVEEWDKALSHPECFNT